MRRLAAVPAIVLACLAGCLDIPGPGGTTQNALGLILSAPVRGPVSATRVAGPAATALSASVVYVSLPPGSVPAGVRATITNQATGQSIMTAVVAGGFDPVPVAASVGDTLVTEIAGAASTVLDRVRLAVSLLRPLKTVRTSPPSGGLDVPLNATLEIVFSEPIDSATLTTASVQLWRGTAPVVGTVRFADALRLRVEFHPDGLLAAQTDYRLVVTQAIRDVNGEALAVPLDVAFTTGVNALAAGTLRVDVLGPTTVDPRGVAAPLQGQSFSVRVEVKQSCCVNPVDSVGSVLSTDTSATSVITLALGTSAPGASLVGTLTATAVKGVASFANLSLDRPGTYALTATAGALTGTTPWFLVYAGAGSLVQVTAGGTHTCGRTYAGVWYCWGRNDHGQLGDGTTTDRTSPVPVAGGQSFALVMAGGSHTCGLTAAGHAYCWGLNDHGQLGDGSTTDRTSPVAVAGSLTFLSLSAGDSHTCGFTGYPSTEVGLVSCWGSNASGQLGDGTTVDRTIPQTIAGITLFGPMLSAGGQHTCGLYWDVGVDYCWGSNSRGQLDNGTTLSATSPVPMTGVGTTGFEAVAAGGYHTCAEAGGSDFLSFAWYCWGANENGQLGDGTTVDRASAVLVGGGMPFVAENGVSAGAQHTCGVSATGTYPFQIPAGAYCWGLNGSGQLGDGTTAQRMSPVRVTGGLSFVSVSAGGSHTCAVSGTGAYCWGANASGQLGTGTTTASSVPGKVAGQP